jgi:hypothetical protein
MGVSSVWKERYPGWHVPSGIPQQEITNGEEESNRAREVAVPGG